MVIRGDVLAKMTEEEVRKLWPENKTPREDYSDAPDLIYHPGLHGIRAVIADE